ncbi:MAG: transglutaminase domain-containing protein [Clostridia bacterium]|nr:transglutaminase domain-containing protein [Clostridia bacterium]
MEWRDRWTDLLGSALVSSVMGMALTMMLCQALSVDAVTGMVAISCVLTGLIFAVGSMSKKGAIAAFALVIGLIAVLSFSRFRFFSSLGGLISQVAALTSGEEASINEYATTIALFIGVALTAFLFWLVDMDGGVYPALALCIVLMMCAWLLSRSINTTYAFLAAAGMACMFTRAADSKTAYVRAIPTALIVALLAIMLIPSGNPTWQPLEQAAQKVRDMFNDYFFYTDPRTTYSISSDGFQPMGEVLGGPADPDLSNVMIVETDDTLLLRGSIKRTYTTYSWTESAINSRYVFIDPMRRAIRDGVFDIDKLEGLDVSGALERVNALVTVVSESISTLFVPHRLIDLDISLDLAAYFSTSGEVFITRGVQPSDTYGIDAYIQTGDTRAMRQLVVSASGRADDDYESIRQAYTELPAGIEDGVYRLAQTITQNAITPYDKALALDSYLKENYSYTLDVNYPPRNRDFVSFFLLQSRRGYCSYFASAMAVMGRMVGLPTRYVEGYMVPARSSGTTLVTGKNAHAWVEVYFSGIGWVTFNPTPGSGDSYTSDGQSSGERDLGDEQGDYDSDYMDDTGAEPTPSPDAGEDDDSGEDESDADDAGDDGDDTAQGDPSQGESDETADSQPEDDPEGETYEDYYDNPDDRPNLWWILLIVPLAVAIAFLAKRLKDSNPNAMTRGMKNTSEKLLTWYRAILLALEYQGQSPAPGETPTQFAARLTQAKLADMSFVAVASQLSMNSYAAKKPDVIALKQARQSYGQLVSQLKLIERLKWYCHRVAKGIGDIENIP